LVAGCLCLDHIIAAAKGGSPRYRLYRLQQADDKRVAAGARIRFILPSGRIRAVEERWTIERAGMQKPTRPPGTPAHLFAAKMLWIAITNQFIRSA
jgi:hypothetical protein